MIKSVAIFLVTARALLVTSDSINGMIVKNPEYMAGNQQSTLQITHSFSILNCSISFFSYSLN
jgi:hypothetical protein